MNKQTQEALKMAIETLISMDYLGKEKSDSIYYRDEKFGDDDQLADVINACKAALEQPAQPLTRDWIGTALERADKDEAFRKGLIGELAQPLSDDEIKSLIHNAEFYNLDGIEFVRTVEKAHGIGVKDEV